MLILCISSFFFNPFYEPSRNKSYKILLLNIGYILQEVWLPPKFQGSIFLGPHPAETYMLNLECVHQCWQNGGFAVSIALYSQPFVVGPTVAPMTIVSERFTIFDVLLLTVPLYGRAVLFPLSKTGIKILRL